MRGLWVFRGLARSQLTRPQIISYSTRFPFRAYSVESNGDITSRLKTDLKAAMKSKDTLKSTTIRSVLSEIYNAEKQVAPKTMSPSDVMTVVRKAEQRRLDSAKQFESASRADLAEKEHQEATLLGSYLPPMLSIDQIDAILRKIIAATPANENPKKAKGLAMKAFYTEVDKSSVQSEVVKQRLDELWPAA